eukprot:Phypoly_transcript_03950.p1 GENE.Phypoly_transcript_03950~~Phypoly_transcript_03950.p1  ORF type:complete len:756 (+),score=109.87 Phypoly_transcript_03950:25-2292(+)
MEGDTVQPEVAHGLKAKRFINFKWGVGNDIVLFNSTHGPHEKNIPAKRKENEKDRATICKMDCVLQETVQFVNKTHLDFVQLQGGRNEATERNKLRVLQQYGLKFRTSLHQLTNALQSAIESSSYMGEPLFPPAQTSNTRQNYTDIPKNEIDNFFNDMAAVKVSHVIYQGRKGDAVVDYIKKKGQEKNINVYGVLYDASLQSQNNNINMNDLLSKNEHEFCLAPNMYTWRADLIHRLTAQLQASGKQVGHLDDTGRASVAYVAALEQTDLMRVAWHLCEIFYWAVPPTESSSTVPSPLITDWARASLDPFPIDEGADRSSIEYFWSYIQRLLLRGEISQAVSELAAMPSSHDANTVSLLLQRMPILTGGGLGSEQFLTQHAQWAAECKNKQSSVTNPGATTVLQILSGDETTISELSRGWIELLLSFLLYKSPGYYVNMEKLAYRCQQYFTNSPFDELLFSIIQRNQYRTLELSSNYFPPVFAAHLADIFQQVGIISASTTENGTTISEGYLMRYGISLLSHSWAWEVACDYFAHCGPFARGLLQEVVDRQQVTHDHKFEKILRVVRSYQLVPTPALRSYAMYLHTQKRYANCAQWLLSGADSDRLLQYAEWLVFNVKKIQNSLPKIISALESLPTAAKQDTTQVSILNDSRLSFLIQYEHYLATCKGTNKASVVSQVQQLVDLLHTAPQSLWDEMMGETLSLLLESSDPIGVDSTMQLMHFLTSHEDEISPELRMRLRLALSQNLAHSFATAVR